MACSAGAARLCTHGAPREARVASHTWPDATARPAAAHMRTPYRPRPRLVLPAPAEISLNLLYEPYSLNLFSEPLAHVSSRSFPVGGTGFEFRCLEYGRRVTHMSAVPHPIVERGCPMSRAEVSAHRVGRSLCNYIPLGGANGPPSTVDRNGPSKTKAGELGNLEGIGRCCTA